MLGNNDYSGRFSLSTLPLRRHNTTDRPVLREVRLLLRGRPNSIRGKNGRHSGRREGFDGSWREWLRPYSRGSAGGRGTEGNRKEQGSQWLLAQRIWTKLKRTNRSRLDMFRSRIGCRVRDQHTRRRSWITWSGCYQCSKRSYLWQWWCRATTRAALGASSLNCFPTTDILVSWYVFRIRIRFGLYFLTLF